MPRATLHTGIELEYDTFGSSDDPALLLVSGFNTQMITWREEFCQRFADQGRFVIRYDNRDCGLSTKLDGEHVDAFAVMAAVMGGHEPPPVPYTLSDMAADGIGLLAVLGIERAHVLGASMGGMIVQTMAIEHPDRLHSVTSIMSNVGGLEYGQPTPEAMEVLLSPPPTDCDAAIERAARYAVWGSKRWFDLDRVQEIAAASFDRSVTPQGATRQFAAVWASGDRTERLRSVTTPMLVIHGLDDTLITPSGGRRTAEVVPGAHLVELADMGHDLPEPLWPLIVDAVVAHGDVAVQTVGEVPVG
jgi:pimeloyl-ACP methyl ester carboxylesterase